MLGRGAGAGATTGAGGRVEGRAEGLGAAWTKRDAGQKSVQRSRCL